MIQASNWLSATRMIYELFVPPVYIFLSKKFKVEVGLAILRDIMKLLISYYCVLIYFCAFFAPYKIKKRWNRYQTSVSSIYQRRERDSNPRTFWVNGFQDRRIRPLCHLSGAKIRAVMFHSKSICSFKYFFFIKPLPSIKWFEELFPLICFRFCMKFLVIMKRPRSSGFCWSYFPWIMLCESYW